MRVDLTSGVVRIALEAQLYRDDGAGVKTLSLSADNSTGFLGLVVTNVRWDTQGCCKQEVTNSFDHQNEG
jgi:hypothetical protein